MCFATCVIRHDTEINTRIHPLRHKHGHISWQHLPCGRSKNAIEIKAPLLCLAICTQAPAYASACTLRILTSVCPPIFIMFNLHMHHAVTGIRRRWPTVAVGHHDTPRIFPECILYEQQFATGHIPVGHRHCQHSRAKTNLPNLQSHCPCVTIRKLLGVVRLAKASAYR